MWLCVLCSCIKWPLCPEVMLSSRQCKGLKRLTMACLKSSRCSPFNNSVFLVFYFWEIGISGIWKGQCFYQMKVTVNKSQLLSASVVQQTKDDVSKCSDGHGLKSVAWMYWERVHQHFAGPWLPFTEERIFMTCTEAHQQRAIEMFCFLCCPSL